MVNRQCLKSSSFRQAEHKVHILDGLPRCPLNQVINATDNDELPCSGINGGVNETEVIPPGVLGVRRGFYYLDKGFILIEVQVKLP